MLEQLQKMIVRMTVDPQFAQLVYDKNAEAAKEYGVTEAELHMIGMIPSSAFEHYQIDVAQDTIRLRANRFVSRTFAMLGTERRNLFLHRFIWENPMVQTEWVQSIGTFHRYIEAQLGATPGDEQVKEVLRFEMLLHSIDENSEQPCHVERGIVLSPQVQVGEFQMDPTVLVNESATYEELVNAFGETRKLLVSVDGVVTDLFELEDFQYQTLLLCREPIEAAKLEQCLVERFHEMPAEQVKGLLTSFLEELWEMEFLIGERV